MPSRFRELRRFREQIFSGIQPGIPIYLPVELETRGFKIKFYNPSDVKIGELGSDVKEGRVSKVEFELLDLGCGAFSLLLDDYPSFDIEYRTRVDIHPYFDEIPWFTGFIQTLPQPGKKKPYEYTGYGFFEQLDWVTVSGTYENQDIANIVKNIIETMVAPYTQIIYNSSKIETTGYVVDSVDFYLVKAKDAIQTLADMAQGYEFGVDNSREFYFRPVDTNIYYSLWAGKHFQEFEIEEDPTEVRNRLYIKVGLIQGEGYGWIKEGSNCIGYVEDLDSIAAYGLREEVITAPETLNVSDATQWAEEILAKKKNPKISAKLKNIFFDKTKTKIDAKGKIRITTADGFEYVLTIDKVSYSISPSGILGQIDLY